MRLRGGNVGNNRQLLIRNILPADAALLADSGTRTVCRHQQRAADLLAVRQGDVNVLFVARHVHYPCRAMQRHAARAFEQRKQPLADFMQLNHLSQRINLIIPRLDGDKPGVTAIADVYRFNGGGAVGQILPDADARQVRHGTLGQRDGAGVKPWMRGTGRRRGLNQMHRQLALG